MQAVLKKYKRFKKRFYRGPKNMGALRIPKFVGYQTVTLTALYWLNYLVNTQLTLIGRIMILMGTLMIAYCLIDPYVLPMSYLSFGIIIVFTVNLVIGWIFKPRIKIDRNIPEKAICEAPVPVKYHIKNTGFLPCWDLKLDAIHYPGCKFSETIVIPAFGKEEEMILDSSIKFNHRGVYQIPKAFGESSFPFGLWKWGRWGEGNREIRVVPRPLHLNNIRIDFLAGENDQNFFESTMGSGMEFASCREFRFGDNPKHIHWPSWARTMTPVVREMCDEGKPAVSVFFDNCFPVTILNKYTDIQNEFEIAVSLLAGVSLYMKNKNFCIRNFFIGDELTVFPGHNSNEIHEKVLDMCCDIQDERKSTELELSNHMLDQLSSTKGLFIILQNWDQSRKTMMQKLAESGLPVKAILLGNKKPLDTGICSFISYAELMSGKVSVI